MPVALAGFDVHDIADGDLALVGFRGNHSPACSDHQNLVAIMDMPPGGRAVAKVNHVAAKVVRLAVADDRLPGSAIGVAVSIGFSGRSLILSTRIFYLLGDKNYSNTKSAKTEFTAEAQSSQRSEY
jgi:hypothetical protein